MANIASARKRARQSEKSRQANASKRSLLRSSIRKVIDAANNKDKDAATAALQKAVPVIDRMVNKGIIHRNKAARHKQQLNNLVREL
ncbi:MAG TPA: 30S ribosomal protein S20 [Gammaproteobacteria bacterium]|nr:30S ribosomal protein S20 [Gammaproteobacteria bacterium]